MPFAGIFSSTTRKIGGVGVDAVIQENHKSQVRVTQHPVEIGANINDHAIIQPKEYEMQGVVSNLPDKWYKFSVPSFLSGSKETRAASAYEMLLAVQEKREPVDVQTGLKSYKNMILEKLEVDRDRETSGGLYFTAKLREVIIIRNKSVQVDEGQFKNGKTREQTSPTKDRGRQQAPEVDSSQKSSDLKNGLIK